MYVLAHTHKKKCFIFRNAYKSIFAHTPTNSVTTNASIPAAIIEAEKKIKSYVFQG